MAKFKKGDRALIVAGKNAGKKGTHVSKTPVSMHVRLDGKKNSQIFRNASVKLLTLEEDSASSATTSQGLPTPKSAQSSVSSVTCGYEGKSDDVSLPATPRSQNKALELALALEKVTIELRRIQSEIAKLNTYS